MSSNSNRSRENDPFNNAGKVTLDTSGHLSVGIGAGLGIDTTSGDLTVGTGGGMSIDLGA